MLGGRKYSSVDPTGRNSGRRGGQRAFEEVIHLAVADVFPPEFEKFHAQVARQARDEWLAKMQVKPVIRTFVDGREGASEDTVMPYGIIRYEFLRLQQIAVWAYQEAVRLSEKFEKSGHYKESWFFIEEEKGRRIEPGEIAAMESSGAGSLVKGVYLVNDADYARKIHTKKIPWHAPPGIVERIHASVKSKFGNQVKTHVVFMELTNPYRLVHPRTLRGRIIEPAGSPITYPALLMKVGF